MKKILLFLFLIFLFTCYGRFSSFDNEKAATYVTQHSLSKSHNCCAWYVMKALWVGGKPCIILPAFAYSNYLPALGFKEIETKDYKIGDICVFPRVKGHIFGHIAMWNGKQWVSDFKQKGIIVSKAYKEYKIFRRTK